MDGDGGCAQQTIKVQVNILLNLCMDGMVGCRLTGRWVKFDYAQRDRWEVENLYWEWLVLCRTSLGIVEVSKQSL